MHVDCYDHGNDVDFASENLRCNVGEPVECAFHCSKVNVHILAFDPAQVVKPSFRLSIGGARPATITQYEQGCLEELEILCGMATMIKVVVIANSKFLRLASARTPDYSVQIIIWLRTSFFARNSIQSNTDNLCDKTIRLSTDKVF
jgi:hypothetical protein